MNKTVLYEKGLIATCGESGCCVRIRNRQAARVFRGAKTCPVCGKNSFRVLNPFEVGQSRGIPS